MEIIVSVLPRRYHFELSHRRSNFFGFAFNDLTAAQKKTAVKKLMASLLSTTAPSFDINYGSRNFGREYPFEAKPPLIQIRQTFSAEENHKNAMLPELLEEGLRSFAAYFLYCKSGKRLRKNLVLSYEKNSNFPNEFLVKAELDAAGQEKIKDAVLLEAFAGKASA